MRPGLAFVDAGDRRLTPLVLVHGDFSTGERAWRLQLEGLSSVHRLLAVDRRGHGRSPREPRPYTIAGDAEDVLQAASRAGVGAFHLVGHSYGGLVALEIACQAPGRLLSLHLIEPPYMALLPDDPDVAALREQSGACYRQAAQWPPDRIVSAFFTMLAGPDAVARLRESRAWNVLVAEAKRIADAQFPGTYPAERLAALRPAWPVVVYTGERSHPGMQKIARRLAEGCPGAKRVEIRGAGHDVQRAAEAFHEHLLAVTRPEG